MPKIKIDKDIFVVFLIGPAFWALDSLAVTILYKADFTQQFFFPKGFDLVICVFLLIVPGIAGLLVARGSDAAPSAAASDPQPRRSKPADGELFRLKLEAERKHTEEEVRRQEQQKRAQEVQALDKKYAAELETRITEEKKRVEVLVRLQEQQKSDDAIKALKQKYDDLLRAEKEAEHKRTEESVRLQEQKKMQDSINALELQHRQDIKSRIMEERQNIENAIREEEQLALEKEIHRVEERKDLELAKRIAEERKNAEERILAEEKIKTDDALDALKHKYDADLRREKDAQRIQIESSIRIQEQKKSEEAIQEKQMLLDKIVRLEKEAERKDAGETVRRQQELFESQIGALKKQYQEELSTRLSEERMLIEESVRLEEQQKSGQSENDRKEKYDELLRIELEAQRTRIEQEEKQKREKEIRVLQEKHAEDLETRFADERKQAETLLHEETVKKSQERLKIEESIRQAVRMDVDALRQQEQKKAQDMIRDLEAKFNQEIVLRIAQERKDIEESVRKEEQKKAQDALNALESKYAQMAATQAAKPVAIKQESASRTTAIPEISRLVKGLSQEIMNPLGGVINNIKLIKIKMMQDRDLKSAELKDSVNLIEENAVLCKNILYSLSNASGLSSQAAFSNISFNDVVAKINTMFGQEMKLQNITFSKILQDKIPQIKGDALLLAQVMFNIVSNARWAIKSNVFTTTGTITITTQVSPDENFVEILVSDTGLGIAEGDLPHIFEPFFTTKEDGLGLGLTVAERIIKDHSGEISIETKEGKGTTVKITLPAIKT